MLKTGEMGHIIITVAHTGIFILNIDEHKFLVVKWNCFQHSTQINNSNEVGK